LKEARVPLIDDAVAHAVANHSRHALTVKAFGIPTRAACARPTEEARHRCAHREGCARRAARQGDIIGEDQAVHEGSRIAGVG
jgi:hypothetical protein